LCVDWPGPVADEEQRAGDVEHDHQKALRMWRAFAWPTSAWCGLDGNARRTGVYDKTK